MNKAVIFDMDGVLVDNNKYHDRAWIEFCKRKGLSIDSKEITARFGNTNDEYFRFLFGEGLSREENDQLAEEKEAIYREIYAAEIEPAKGLIDLLGELKENNFKIGVATSAPTSNLNFVLEKLNIRFYFAALVDASMITKGKPDPEVFLKTADLLEVPASQCLVFEDSVHGVNAAVNAKMKVVALTTTFPEEKLAIANRIIKDFREITARDIQNLLNSN
ncbi:MAG: HAD family phosphatase [Bacteroidota bacterium]|nr:HAD family phosphatase [Bacteroidota bacterium]